MLVLKLGTVGMAMAIGVWGQSGAALRMTEIQVIGSHNSYHAGLAPSAMAHLRQVNPKAAEALDYRHPGLTEQLQAGVRQLEIDVYEDQAGGRFATPKMTAAIAKAGLPPDPPFDPEGLMQKPGFKVVHVKDVDFRSNCQPFKGCLSQIRKWSQAHPRHLPVYVLVETKDPNPEPGPPLVQRGRLSTESLTALDAEIRSVFRADELITPDDVRAGRKTLEEAVLAKGWPTLESARGKVVFLLDQERVGPLYAVGHRHLAGRVMFTNAEPGTPNAAFVKMNDTDADPERVAALVRRGYLVRTMTDSEGVATDARDTSRRDAAMKSGAQLLSTDYPFAWKAASGYSVHFESGIARCNPVLPPRTCRADLLIE